MTAEIHRPVYQHAKRPQWGFAILAWEERTKRGYQFADGQLRVINENFYHLLESVDSADNDLGAVVQELESKLDLSEARRELATTAKTGTPVMTLDDQLRVFAHLYPGGFEDDAWIAETRGGDGRKRRKAHREPAIAHAQEMLAEAPLRAFATAGDWAGLHKAVAGVLAATNLVSPSADMPTINDMPEELYEPFGAAVINVLHGEGDYTPRFGALLTVLGKSAKRPTWPLSTVMAALVHPQDHVPVKPNVFRQQARWLAPRLKVSTTPTGASYAQLLDLAKTLRAKLNGAGLAPRDLPDVFDFMWTTLRPKAQALRKELRSTS